MERKAAPEETGAFVPVVGTSGFGKSVVRAPFARSETKGRLALFKADFESELRGETEASETFFFGSADEVRESDAYRTWCDYLTDAEMVAIGKKIAAG